MFILTILACGGLVLLIGRNDGSPLLAMTQQSAVTRGIGGGLLIVAAVAAVPLLGFFTVADSLYGLFTSSTGGPDGALAVLIGILMSIGISVLMSAPTSITLAIVGALTGVSLGNGLQVEWPFVTRVLALGLAAPLIACAAAFLLARLPLRLPEGASGSKFLNLMRHGSLAVLALAYGANDGQKVLFASALALGVSPAVARLNPWLILATSVLFTTGMVLGLRKGGLSLRQGVAPLSPVALMWSQFSTGVVVWAGAVTGTPLSMTQSLTGALMGTGLARSSRSVRWNAAGRIGLTWLWTLPVAGICGYGAALLFDWILS